MKQQFVRIYLWFVAIVLSLTALAKIPAVFASLTTLCLEEPMFGDLQPLPNEVILVLAAGIEFSIVMLIYFSRSHWVPCFVSALWGSICLAARIYFTEYNIDCGCLGWLAKPGPTTNLIVGLLALAIALGGYIALGIIWLDSAVPPEAPPRNAKSLFVKSYLYFVAVALSITFVGKLPAILFNKSLEASIFGRFQPLSNEYILTIAAGIEFSIVMLICFSRSQWMPCLVSALWGSICLVTRVYFTFADTDCSCSGWLAKPGPMTNLIVGLLAGAIATGGYVALRIIRRDSWPVQLKPGRSLPHHV